MKIKRTILIILVVLSIVLIDTVQAKIFNNRPVISIVEDYNGGDLYQKSKGLLVDTYIYLVIPLFLSCFFLFHIFLYVFSP